MMKKCLSILLLFVFCFSVSIVALADDETVDLSTPRFMVSEYSLNKEYLTPNKNSVLTVIFKNYSSTKAVYNVKLSVVDESGEIKINNLSTYLSKIEPNSTYSWEISLTAAKKCDYR